MPSYNMRDVYIAQCLADEDAFSLEQLTDLLTEGRQIPFRMSEKEQLEAKVWALGWVK